MQDSFRQFLENNSDKELANNANAFKELDFQTIKLLRKIKYHLIKSLILAQDERWRRA